MANKTDRVQIDFNLDKIDLPDEARSYRFPFKGKNFETIDLADVSYEDMEKAMRETENKGSRPLVDLFLGDQAKDFWELKPTVWQVEHLGKSLEPVLKAIVGDSGESAGS